ncbi:hypothetical protein FIBSPDRAFT_965926 [Athelia psychrophila]|uniref:Uncharacterized protein n=1 Tax=Athelia psychrophila TaxID=1759441 RepID=A0A167XD80_9AGAM|nr:hypothetical protein FIBSPDRAFT_965926 [Fibularhizoctonia sp. CBS 109695]
MDNQFAHMDGTDTVTMSMSEMLIAAGPDPGSSQSIATFVQGKAPDGRFIRLDPGKDREIINVKDMKFSIDIDSIIITSHKLHIIGGSLEVDVLPNARNEAPMSKSNHTYVAALLGGP